MCVCVCVSRHQVGKGNDGCVWVCICVEEEMLFVSVEGCVHVYGEIGCLFVETVVCVCVHRD